jgi:hypothetical protein
MPPSTKTIGEWTVSELEQNKQQLDALLTESDTIIENTLKSLQLKVQSLHSMMNEKQQIEKEIARRATERIARRAQEELIAAQAGVMTNRERELLQLFRHWQDIDSNQPDSN